MECPYREGKRKCIWMVASGCIHPRVTTDIKKQCDGKVPRYKTEQTIFL
jgi:hypothetical protein